MSLNCIIKHIKERLFNEQGAGTVEYVIVVLVAIVIGSGLLAFGNQVSGQVTKTGGSISISAWLPILPTPRNLSKWSHTYPALNMEARMWSSVRDSQL